MVGHFRALTLCLAALKLVGGEGGVELEVKFRWEVEVMVRERWVSFGLSRK